MQFYIFLLSKVPTLSPKPLSTQTTYLQASLASARTSEKTKVKQLNARAGTRIILFIVLVYCCYTVELLLSASPALLIFHCKRSKLNQYVHCGSILKKWMKMVMVTYLVVNL